MNSSMPTKIVVTLLFVVVGLPPGLCSLSGMTTAITSTGSALIFGMPSLIGLTIFGLMLWWLIRTWRSP